VAQLLNDLITASEGGARSKLADGCLKGLCYDRRRNLRRRELGAAISAVLLGLRVFRVTFRALDGHVAFPFCGGLKITSIREEVNRRGGRNRSAPGVTRTPDLLILSQQSI
jgi:hypothetical protein